MKRSLLAVCVAASTVVVSTLGQIRVSPDNATVYSQGATSVFLTYGGVVGKRPVDACWCGAIVSAAPDAGFKCDPSTMFGCLPVRYNQASLNSNGTYTDIMSIPPSVARRAYVDATKGNEATFFYVRRFSSLTDGPDEYVPVTLRLGGNGAAVPFSLTDIKLSWGIDKPVLFVRADEKLPRPAAEISYTGTGRLAGRWELVKPGDELPSQHDLLTESTLPVEERGSQRRYTELSRFNVYLPPAGRFTLPGPEVWRMQSKLDGMYLILLRIESVDDGRGDSILADSGGGTAIVPSGAVAGFSLPTLRYYVGAGGQGVTVATANAFSQMLPEDNALSHQGQPLEFSWKDIEGAVYYRLELEDASGSTLISAILVNGAAFYRAPSWLAERVRAGAGTKLGPASMKWRVVAFDSRGTAFAESGSRMLRFAK